MNRREMLLTSGAAALGLAFPFGRAVRAAEGKRRILMYTKSVGFEHPVVKRKGDQLSLAERIVTDLGAKHNFDVNCTKDGRVFVRYSGTEPKVRSSSISLSSTFARRRTPSRIRSGVG